MEIRQRSIKRRTRRVVAADLGFDLSAIGLLGNHFGLVRTSLAVSPR